MASTLVASAAMPSSRRGKSGVRGGIYDSYILALAWQPQFSYEACRSNPLLADKTDLLSADSPPLKSLSAHGLWPEYDATSAPYGWPEFCMNASDTQKLSNDTLAACNTTEDWQSTSLSFAWDPLFALREWRRHGSCTPWTQREYFVALEDARDELSAGSGAQAILASRQAAGNLSKAALEDAFRSDTGAAPALRCVPETCDLREVYLGVEAKASASKRPLTGKGHGVAIAPNHPGGRDDTLQTTDCGHCSTVRLAPWHGCPPMPPRPPATPPRPPVAPQLLVQDPSASAGAWTILLGIGASVLAVVGLLLLLRARHLLKRFFYAQLSSYVDVQPIQPAAGSGLSLGPAAAASRAIDHFERRIERGAQWIVERAPGSRGRGGARKSGGWVAAGTELSPRLEPASPDEPSPTLGAAMPTGAFLAAQREVALAGRRRDTCHGIDWNPDDGIDSMDEEPNAAHLRRPHLALAPPFMTHHRGTASRGAAPPLGHLVVDDSEIVD